MANIRVVLDRPPFDGMAITFNAPCACNKVEGLTVSYSGLSDNFTFRDAHGHDLTGLGNLFEEGAYVRAILDTKNWYAYLQNADTNAYLEAKFAAISNYEDPYFTGCQYRLVDGEKEWLNPPLDTEVAYRTTERWVGCPVYTKLVDFGALPGANGVKSKTFDEGAYNSLRVLRCVASCKDNQIATTFPAQVDSGTITFSTSWYGEYGFRGEYRITCNNRTDIDMSAESALVQVWYVDGNQLDRILEEINK